MICVWIPEWQVLLNVGPSTPGCCASLDEHGGIMHALQALADSKHEIKHWYVQDNHTLTAENNACPLNHL